jgi:hypothetical protein
MCKTPDGFFPDDFNGKGVNSFKAYTIKLLFDNCHHFNVRASEHDCRHHRSGIMDTSAFEFEA